MYMCVYILLPLMGYLLVVYNFHNFYYGYLCPPILKFLVHGFCRSFYTFKYFSAGPHQ